MKKYLLTMAAIMVMGSMNAQEVMNLKMTDGRTVGVPVEKVNKVYFDTMQVKPSEEVQELQAFKQHLTLCNDKLGENFDASNLVDLNSSLTRLLNLTLLNDSTVKKLNERIQNRIQANMVKLDTIKNPTNYEKSLMAIGYEYETTYNFPNVHFVYNTTTKSWDVSELTDDIMISYPEKDGTLTTIVITPKSDIYKEVATLRSLQTATPAKSKIIYRVKFCRDYTINITRGNEALVLGEVTHGDTNFEMSFDTNITMNIGKYCLKYSKSAVAGTGTSESSPLPFTKDSVAIYKDGTKLISADYNMEFVSNNNVDYLNVKNLVVDFFGNIQLKGGISNYIKTIPYLTAAIHSADSATIAQYTDSLNQNVKLGLYYDNVDKKIGDCSMGAGTIGIDSWTVLPYITFETVGTPTSFIQELTLKELGGIYSLYKSFNRDVIFGLINNIRKFQSAVASNQQ